MAQGERYLELHPGTLPTDNVGYQLGATQIDIMTHDAMSWLTKEYTFDSSGVHKIDDLRALKVMGRIIPAVVESALLTMPSNEAPERMLEVIKFDPQPRHLPQGTDIAARINTLPETAAVWADRYITEMLKKIATARSGAKRT